MLSLQHRNLFEPVIHTGSALLSITDHHNGQFGKGDGCRKISMITYDDTCQTRLVTPAAFPLRV